MITYERVMPCASAQTKQNHPIILIRPIRGTLLISPSAGCSASFPISYIPIYLSFIFEDKSLEPPAYVHMTPSHANHSPRQARPIPAVIIPNVICTTQQHLCVCACPVFPLTYPLVLVCVLHLDILRSRSTLFFIHAPEPLDTIVQQ